jgi:hypothetical protein
MPSRVPAFSPTRKTQERHRRIPAIPNAKVTADLTLHRSKAIDLTLPLNFSSIFGSPIATLLLYTSRARNPYVSLAQ